ncbi:MAG TPA: bifunctional riboflavin kinase/FAD synthetase [Methylomirabilota bacterium]|nr:bifunctional riboflavin kinase/FAD synthetase [Methylomirabilota bacterium]
MAMKVFRDPLGADEPPRRAVLSIGNFDGVHLGHQAVLRHVVERGETLATVAAAMTLDPHPVKLLRPRQAPQLVTTLEQRLELIARTGIQATLVLPFTHRLSRMPAEAFVREVLVERLAIREVYIGANFRFGADRGGDVALLERMGAELGFAAAASPIVEIPSGVVSSSRVREAVAAGDVTEAAAMLGRFVFIDGRVLEGKRLGRKLGFPTLNVEVDNELHPARGVYVTAVHIPSFGRTFASVTNVGTRPTVYENSILTVETHLLDFSADVYREPVRLFFLRRLRDEMSFPSTVQLMAQIQKDVEASRLHFLQHPVESLELIIP